MDVPRPKHTLREYVAQYRREHTQFGTKVTHMIGIPMVVVAVPTALVNPPAAIGLALGGWALQVVGHVIFEGNRPAMAPDPYYTLAAPAWVAGEWLQLFGLPLPELIAPAEDVSSPTVTNGEAVAAAS
ncbi:MAG: DUF962 domain-containing protein [Polyangiaceae bacterium]|nr:DUF962 domain-containing protein [Polyangiaceae bacterium]